MSIPTLKRLAVVLGVFCVGLSVGGVFLLRSSVSLKLEAAFADEQTEVFDAMRTRALSSAVPDDIADSLSYVVSYYPSGSKQGEGTALDHVVERHRQAVVRDIVAHLRRTTGLDLGESPEPWILKYARASKGLTE